MGWECHLRVPSGMQVQLYKWQITVTAIKSLSSQTQNA